MRPKSYDPNLQPQTFILCSYVLGSNSWSETDYLAEFKSLVNTAGFIPSVEHLLKLRQVDSVNFFTKGKLNEVVEICSLNKIERIILSSSLTPMQHRNLESLTGTEVIDRTDLILHIFKNAAISSEGKLQVEIAELNIKKTRVSGLGRDMGQQQFGVGSRGPGETEKEVLYRLYSDEILKLERKIKTLAVTKDVQRKRRLRSGLMMASFVGYTNAGKSSLLNQLTGAEVLVEDKLFATLDTTTKELYLAPNQKMLISDTVGFISELPHHLVKAFRSTLDELVFSDILLHVVDISNLSWLNQIQTVQKTLQDIQISKPMLYVFNKIDKVDESVLEVIRNYAEEEGLDFIFVSSLSNDGISPLKNFLVNFVKRKSLKN